MDILDLEQSLKFAHFNGTGLNLEQRFHLENGIQRLLNSDHSHSFEELKFWGRVEGIKYDYYICVGVIYTDQYEFPTKRFFWASSTDFNFKPFNQMNNQHYDEFDKLTAMFTGEPNKIYIRVEPDKLPGEDEETKPLDAPKEKDPLASTEEEDPNATFVPRNLTEVDRLQITIYAIENDCRIMPKGAVKLTDQHEVRVNNAFRGLSLEEAMLVQNYVHFRKVQDHLKAQGLEKDDCVFRNDFLDEASNQKIRGTLSAQKVGTKGDTVLIRNHLWPGYATYHVANSQTHGSFYFGEGLKNMELAFQI